jgi:hypothetical protein
MTPAEEETPLLRQLFQKQGFVVFANAVPAWLRDYCERTILETEAAGLWQSGDDSDHAWQEVMLRTPLDLESFFDTLGIASALDPVRRTSQWINRYIGKQFIPGHRDASGDAHLLFLIQERPAEAGRLWLGSEERPIPIGPGDAVLFSASTTLHGMTAPLQAMERVTFNVRLWLT